MLQFGSSDRLAWYKFVISNHIFETVSEQALQELVDSATTN